jgi:predicted acetyltransferase
MPELVAPTTNVRASFVHAIAECDHDDAERASLAGEQLSHFLGWQHPDGFARYVEALRARALPDTPRPAGFVPDTVLWWVEGAEFVGRISIRHRLTPFLREIGGHIGYGVRVARRGEGHATAMLAAALPVAFDLGIDPALVTCDVDNLASRRVIERNGGELDDVHEGKLRFWVPTGADTGPVN